MHILFGTLPGSISNATLHNSAHGFRQQLWSGSGQCWRIIRAATKCIALADGKKSAIEIKRNSAPHLSKGFHIACEDILPDRKFVIYSGKDTFPMGDGIVATSLINMMREILDNYKLPPDHKVLTERL